jgi:hypothetical protein
MDAQQRAALVAAYVAGPAVIRASVEGTSDEQLDARPSDGGWTPREVVHHTADSEMTSGIRLRRLIAEDNPTIVGYDGDEFARRLHYSDRPIGPALDAIGASRLTPAEWGRTGTHSESGPYSVEHWLEIYANHCHDHADQIRRALAEVT